jgi:dTDP-4-amino-4,6-dideoxy-D-galactose acyltransferase
MIVKLLPWDSAFFDLNVGELVINGSNNGDIKISDDFDLIYLKASEAKEISLPNYSETFSETKVIFERTDFIKNEGIPDTIGSVFDGPYSIVQLYELAEESGRYSRFHLDLRFSETNFKKLYHTWIDNSLSGTFADGFLVCQVADRIVGFVTYRTHADHAIIGLIGINAMQQGKGIGSQLIRAVENKLIETGITSLRIPTQLKNERACKFYKKLGYSPMETTVIKHFWRDPLQ